MKIKVVFTDNNKVCHKFIIDLDKVRLDEILTCLEKQFKLK